MKHCQTLLRIVLSLVLGLTWSLHNASATAQSPGFGGFDEAAPVVTAEAVVMADQASVGGATVVAVVIDIAPTYHINPDPARSGPAWFEAQYPTTLRVIDPPEGVRVGRVQYPETHRYAVDYAEQEIEVYEGQVVLLVPVLIGETAALGALELEFELDSQACDPQVCLMPAVIKLTAAVEVVPAGTAIAAPPASRAEWFAGFDPAGWSAIGEESQAPDSAGAGAGAEVQADPGVESREEAGGQEAQPPATWGKLFYTLAIALGAGFLLNFTPCVLPVVPLKVMSLAQHSGGRGRTVLLSLVMAAGVVGFWLAIALALVGLKQFQAINQMFQYPWFNLAVGGVIAVLAVSMLGVFTINLPRVVYQVSPTGDTVVGALGFGVMTAVLATPCAGPMMGGAVVWATQQGVATVLSVFGALGVGMALPYLLLTLFPGLIAKMPRAGAGSELLKQTMGLLMLAAAAFFIGSGVAAMTSDGTSANSRGHWWIVGALIVAAGGWLIVRGLAKACQTSGGRAFATLCGLALIVSGGWVGLSLSKADAVAAGAGGHANGAAAEQGIAWVYYTPERLAEHQAAGRVVVLEFTAAWCLNCKLLEKTVLESERISALLGKPGVTPMKVDITSSKNVAGNALLREMGRVTIPLLVVFDGKGGEVFKADFYTVNQLAEAIERALQASPGS